jgi:inward rectifier potassium channel
MLSMEQEFDSEPQSRKSLLLPILRQRMRPGPLIDSDGKYHVRLSRSLASKCKLYIFKDIFHTLIDLPWIRLAPFIVVTYLLSYLVFALMFWMLPAGSVANVHTFDQIYWFTVQTMSSIGYGFHYPVSTLSNVIMTFSVIYAISLDAMLFGLLYSKFSRPTTRSTGVLFSDTVCFAVRSNGKPFLSFRMINLRQHALISVKCRVFVLFGELMARRTESEQQSSMTVLPASHLTFDVPPDLMSLPCTVFHEIDVRSPLAGWTKERIEATPIFQIICLLEACDATTGDWFQVRKEWNMSCFRWDARFSPVMNVSEDGWRSVDLDFFSSVTPYSPVGMPAGSPRDDDESPVMHRHAADEH